MAKVVTSDRAIAAAHKMQQIINGPLVDQITQLNNQGQILMDPSAWEGRLAGQFRSEWPEVNTTLMKMKDSLEELRVKVQRINKDIEESGGGLR